MSTKETFEFLLKQHNDKKIEITDAMKHSICTELLVKMKNTASTNKAFLRNAEICAFLYKEWGSKYFMGSIEFQFHISSLAQNWSWGQMKDHDSS